MRRPSVVSRYFEHRKRDARRHLINKKAPIPPRRQEMVRGGFNKRGEGDPSFGAMDVPESFEFIGVGAMDVAKLYKIHWVAMDKALL